MIILNIHIKGQMTGCYSTAKIHIFKHGVSPFIKEYMYTTHTVHMLRQGKGVIQNSISELIP